MEKNAQLTGTNQNSFASDQLQNEDTISVTLISNETCVTADMVTSNNIIVRPVPRLTPHITILAKDTVVDAGANLSFAVAVENEGANPTFQMAGQHR